MCPEIPTLDHQHRSDVLTRLTRDVAHDVANMLTVILGQCRLTSRILEKGDLTPERMGKSIVAIELNAERIRQAMDALRLFARLGDDESPQPIPLEAVVSWAVTLSRNSLDKFSIGIELDHPATPVSIVTKRSLITRLVTDCLHLVIEGAIESDCKSIRIVSQKDDEGRDVVDFSVGCGGVGKHSATMAEIEHLTVACDAQWHVTQEQDVTTLRLRFASP